MPDGTGTTTTATTTAPWYQGVAGIDQETVGHWTNAGWANKKPEEIAVEATKSWKAAERHVGAPADQIIRVPKEVSDEKGWNAVWQRLGKPKEAKEYDFAGVKFSDGTALEETFLNTMREAAWSLNLPKDAAASIVQRFTKYLEDAEVGEKAERDAKLLEQKAALKKNWGPNEAPNMFVATQARVALQTAMGFTNERMAKVIESLEQTYGYADTMEMFRVIGTKIGEDKFVTGTNRPAGGPMTRDEAIAKKADLMSDQVWAKAFTAGDKAKQREMMALNTIITGIAAPS